MPANKSLFLCPWSLREQRVLKEIDRWEIVGVVLLRKLISFVNGLARQSPTAVPTMEEQE